MRSLRVEPHAPTPGPRPAEDAVAPSAAAAGGCCDLRRMFDNVTREPMPQRLLDLCDKLEDAFRRGELYTGARGTPRA